MDYFLVLVGVLLLLFGGDWLVKASVDIALRAKISLLVVGMTVVSFATSAPELLVSLKAALEGHIDISFGNVIGSNIANISLILGLTAMVFPMQVSKRTMRVDWGIMFFVTLLLYLFLWNDLLGFWEALVLFILLVLYNLFQIRGSRKQEKENPEISDAKLLKLWQMVFFLAAGIAGLRFGSEFLVKGAVNIATDWGISERVVGLTVVSIGTSLPELAASLIASFKGEQDLSLGNLIGSNIFNILAVLGITGLITDLPVQSAALMSFDFPWLIGISLILLPFMLWMKRGVISRWQGFIMFALYTVYLLGVIGVI
ncbi:calcium/sodium antiporter [Croceimicrobium hydrocarbonivorans]|uniref:Calcium/sodium antiporter n=1 Tax=Croceimicrobium hydrocarbonivorans TaxID=2761580 RepID=A0A7H0VGE9_9FLAO|nr:calcium/sodium antiporter [Croceimicrobium hydrocarbonivorans]QNR24797.1 calcium/sodium antiporter [Croceimicrobium hydrocarbonivorans]